jgi:hypothetical protein
MNNLFNFFDDLDESGYYQMRAEDVELDRQEQEEADFAHYCEEVDTAYDQMIKDEERDIDSCSS